MPKKKRNKIADVFAICNMPNPPENITDISRLLGYVRTNPLIALLNEPTSEAPNGYEIAFRPVIRIRSNK